MNTHAHDPRRPFCPCDECEAKRTLARYDAGLERTFADVLNFTAEQLLKFDGMASRYRKGWDIQ